MRLWPTRKPTVDGRGMEWMFRTRSHTWEQAGLARQLAQETARKAQRQAVLLLPLLTGVLLLYHYRQKLLGLDMPIRIFTVVALVILGWAFARDVGRAAGPALFRRLDPATAGTVGFLLRLATVGLALLVALRVAGLNTQSLAVGGAVTAVVIGLAAQQTIGQLIAGTVLLSARPFRVGDRVRIKGGAIGGEIEGIVSSLGLMYATLAVGDDHVLIPNATLMSLAIMPLREPDAVNLRARLRADVRPTDLQEILQDAITTPLRDEPNIVLEELDGDEVVVRVSATPERAEDGPALADEILAAVARVTRPASEVSVSGRRGEPG